MPPAENRSSRISLDLAICFGLLLAISAVYSQAGNFDFTNYDDPGYVTENSYVRAGLTPASVSWAMKAVVLGNWTPVTLLSHMLVCQWFGLQSGIHHLVNVLFHALATLLLFLALRRSTGATGPSGFVAAVFALHPLHVQSVAWVAERKDVLSAFFFFLALYAYVLYTEHPTLPRYLSVIVSFALGLMSKPMLVTFPLVLLLFDLWPLRRSPRLRLLWEKLPLFALSAASSVVTYLVQRSTGAVAPTPPLTRIENALLSYVTYIAQTFDPTGLAVFYPFPKSVSPWQGIAALAVLLGVSALAIWTWRRAPYLAVGWFWYLGTLLPVIGLVQVGSQSHADRYTYIPMVGLSLALAWGAMDAATHLAARWPPAKLILTGAALALPALCILRSSQEALYWQNSGTLFQRAIDVTSGNWIAEGNLGRYLMDQPGRRVEAMDHLEAALRIEPNDAQSHNNLGLCLFASGLCSSAVPHFEESLRLKPGAVQPLNNLGVCLMRGGDYTGAIPYFEAALRASPDSADIHLNLGATLSKVPGRNLDAIPELEAALRLRPDDPDAHFALGLVFADAGRPLEAISHLEVGQRIRPDPAISLTLQKLYSSTSRTP
jgi:Tfp pilus assembly protein PilF